MVSKVVNINACNIINHKIYAGHIDTILGRMLALADDRGLFLLCFVDKQSVDSESARLSKKLKAEIVFYENEIIKSIKYELIAYFSGENVMFKTPCHILGTDFQKTVWGALKKIPYGETRSYLDVAKSINHPKAFRAVALANAANKFPIIIPCHRVINANGNIGGYAGGASKKMWLLQHELQS